ncbi:hypothetical protein OROHE_015984 [Orobanche hederae]
MILECGTIKAGDFMRSSAYYHIREVKRTRQTAHSTGPSNRDNPVNWIFIWELRVPNKKVF